MEDRTLTIALPVLMHDYWHCWQVVVVRDDEVRPGIGWKEVRFPRGWVRHSGELADVLAALRAEGTPYATRVADNVSLSVQWMGHVLDGNTVGARENDALLKAYRALPYLGETEADRHRTFKWCLENIGIFQFHRISDDAPHLYQGPDPAYYLPHPGQIPPPGSGQTKAGTAGEPALLCVNCRLPVPAGACAVPQVGRAQPEEHA